MTDTNELREALAPCPFCGGGAMFQEEHHNHWRVVCCRCGVRHPYLAAHRLDPRPELVAAWNRRAPDRLRAATPDTASPMTELQRLGQEFDADQVERVARAIGFANNERPETIAKLVRDSHGELVETWVTYLPLARAAITALSQQSPETKP